MKYGKSLDKFGAVLYIIARQRDKKKGESKAQRMRALQRKEVLREF